MAKPSKATKKFEKNQLKGTIERRKEFAKIKQRHQVKAKKKQRAEKRSKAANDDDDSEINREEETAVDMNEDNFFREPVDIPEPHTNTSKSNAAKRKRNEPVDEEESVDAEENEQEEDDEIGIDMAALAEKDPEFYKYLKENDAELLDFNEDDDLAGVDDLSDEEPPSKKRKTKKDEEESDAPDDVTLSMVKKWKSSLSEQFSIRALRQVVLAFRAAAHADDEDDKVFKYNIQSPEVYHEVLITALKQVPQVLSHHLPVKETAAGKLRIPTDSPKFKTLAPLIKSHASSLHYLLGHLSDTKTLRLTLESFEPLLPYLLQFRKFLKVITKAVSSIWSDNSSDEATRIQAFLIIRRLMIIGDAGIREAVLKSTYEGVVKGSRNTTIHTLAGINLMKNSAAEIWGLDQKVSYTAGFTFIRQLAIHLRGNITKPTKDSYKTIYNWQFVHSLDFWSRVLSMHCNSILEAQNGKPSQLRPLIYPVVQVTLGAMRLIPTSTYFPLRFQLMRSLLRISQATETYIPLSAALLEVLSSAEMKKPAKAATLRPLDFSSNIRAPTSYLKTKIYQDGVAEQVIELFSEFFVLWTKSIAYPELQLPVTVMLKRWIKTASNASGNRNGKLNQALTLLVQKSEANSKWIEERRNKVKFSPKDRTEVQNFLKDVQWQDTPLGAFVVSQRKLREERRQVLERGRKEQERHKQTEEDDNSDIEIT
ncbi:Nucleolar Complex 2 protein [Cladophialophora chaetospira]|uniref:Nucleolar Complex 2 protein n=1 Tax=Cladophialophora chaetospira TaxID=386627 RepID=A0AA38X3C9_9EURO|nr:Nucleolar Complex 2 protein [Cladophialophora chaetospira]